ncbi:MAG TPA: hypothetical protein PLP01_09500 [Phycisphaerae bacterium]|nr:hypothetical protein [Phycisphaerae bacterium]HOI55470.1 hypothetical protein [Phycisphaerae bacterium]
MIGFLLVNLGTSGVLFLLVVHMATANALGFYPSTIPAMVQPALAALISLVGLLARRLRLASLLLSSAGLALMVIPWWHARFPGGDDGGGFGWFFVVGSASLAAFMVGVGTAIGGLVCHARNRRRRAASAPDAAAEGAVGPQTAALPSREGAATSSLKSPKNQE